MLIAGEVVESTSTTSEQAAYPAGRVTAGQVLADGVRRHRNQAYGGTGTGLRLPPPGRSPTENTRAPAPVCEHAGSPLGAPGGGAGRARGASISGEEGRGGKSGDATAGGGGRPSAATARVRAWLGLARREVGSRRSARSAGAWLMGTTLSCYLGGRAATTANRHMTSLAVHREVGIPGV